MSSSQQHVLAVNGIELSVRVSGPEHGQPVWLLHGFPECWHSWRHQVPALVAAGFRVFVPEMRGYGRSSAPEAVQAYDLLTLCADIQQAMHAFGQQRVCIVGHDWGAPVAWHLALLEPQRVAALVTLSVPFAGRPKRPASEIMRQVHGEHFNYILYFQQPGVAEAELDADIDASLRLFMGNVGALLQPKPADARLFDGVTVPAGLPQWCSEEDFQAYRQTFAGRGFRGALNWYRNFERTWKRTEFLADAQVQQPTLFLLGDQDPVGVLEAHTLKRMPGKVADLEQHLLADCGHWIQNERPQQVNALLLDFLQRRFT
ncbi:alpha/beta hydrolase [Pseudomonas protegens]|jgi:pimeloyl-ACP methyl ester carboxylesterase|uniref:Alpha/beta hydrolase family protein n=3 Tax=Pseudomonas protegens TaxID=380021 RepID=Q4KCH8_PSEF5|nr:MULTISPECIES: alpha/beta hydrolase [Pseudomonas]GED73826.1 epoxide hydrolase [Pseudomonas fluorescens]AAY92221.1 alpha/beta hydrolase family protein [Pseudomonas protegens Pf-5]AGL84765.1 AB hydrolase superfamily protein YfhM [Pseudomonas protegens CHA0]AQT09828.1 alpha/beta hydrolase [Pseudomonas protegens]ASE23558.1 alpha/beta hydrolase [Pseudomonas protegens]